MTTDETTWAIRRISPGRVFCLNRVGKATFERVAAANLDPDYAAPMAPPPVYAQERWIAILRAQRQTFDELVKSLIAEAHERLAATTRRSSS